MMNVTTNSKGLKKGTAVFLELSLTLFPFFLLTLLFFPQGTQIMNEWAAKLLAKLVPTSHFQIFQTSFFEKKISYLSSFCDAPSTLLKLSWCGFSTLALFITSKTKGEVPYKFISYFLFSVILATSTILLCFPGAFPYTIGSFAEINMKLEVLLWFIFPLMLGALLLQINTPLIYKVFFMFCLMSLTFLLGVVKYAFSLYILMKGTLILTPLMFFIFGPYINLMYLVAFFSFFTSRFNQ